MNHKNGSSVRSSGCLSSFLQSSQQSLFYLILLGDNRTLLLLNTILKLVEEATETIQLLYDQLCELQGKNDLHLKLKSPLSMSVNETNLFLNFCEILIAKKTVENPNIHSNSILDTIRSIFNHFACRNRLRIYVLNVFECLTGPINGYTIQSVKQLSEKKEPLKTLLDNFEENHMIGALQEVLDYRAELYIILQQQAHENSIKLPESSNYPNLNKFIDKEKRLFEQNLGYQIPRLDIELKEKSTEFPTLLKDDEITSLSTNQLNDRIRTLNLQLKKYKRARREATRKEVEDIQKPKSQEISIPRIPSISISHSHFLSEVKPTEKKLSGKLSARLKLGVGQSSPRGSSSFVSVTEVINDEKENILTSPRKIDGFKRRFVKSIRSTSCRIAPTDASDLQEKIRASVKLNGNDKYKNEEFRRSIRNSRKLVCQCTGYYLEQGLDEGNMVDYSAFQNTKSDIIPVGEWYSEYFYEQNHSNYVTRLGEEDIVISVKKEKDIENNTHYRALLRSRATTTGVLIPYHQLRLGIRRGKNVVLSNLFQVINPLLRYKHFSKCNEKAEQELLDFEDLELAKIQKRNTFKVGLVNWKKGNRDENDMFSNCELSKDFTKFLSILGDQIELQRWKKYDGGLDTTQSMGSGKYSLYTEFEKNSFMFHVAAFLPHSSSNNQQVERKRHIGNDVVVIVFKEQNAAPYLPSTVSSHFNHIFIVVTTDGENYQVAVSNAEGVPSFGPPLPKDGIFTDPWALRVFLLQKIINGEIAATKAPAFAKRISKTRELLLRAIFDSRIRVAR